ncbi:alpha/beta hydrolase [[Pseudopropionibacterium] massiliense]|uniref:alpha/beta hydrolase n=1 Tax=[Pseudopropionibacterium] massiliense TaxID=2220000 RepID=UPI00103006D4|nr:alpha/beta hydrolase [[Pseudopropionibacterium] massiliense]
MAITWGDIQNWKHGNLSTAMQDLATLRKGLAEGKSAASKAKGQIQSTGASADAAKASLQKLVEELGERVDDASELGLATSEASDGVWDVETKVHECTSFVAQYPYLSIDDDGGVHWDMDLVPSSPGEFLNTVSPVNFSEAAKSTSTTERVINSLNPLAIASPGLAMGKALFDASPAGLVMDNVERKQKAEELKKLIDAAVNRAAEVDEAYVNRLVGVRDGTYDHSKLKGKAPRLNVPGLGSLPIPGQEDKPWPPEGVDSPTEVSNWWNSLTEEERREFMDKNPDAIRNLDGMPGKVRDELNRKALPGEIEKAEQEMKNAPADSEEAKEAKRRYDDLTKIKEITDKPDPTGKPYQLLGLDASGDGDVRAIVASGDVDTAKNVGTVVPGISTTARDSMGGLVNEANTLRKASGTDHTATVAYLGYDAPPAAEPFKEQNGSLTDIVSSETANKAAPDLNRFNEGIQTWQETQGRDPRITNHGHSYGSLLTGTAARDAKIGLLDAVELHGSPGGGVNDVHEYNVPDGQVYASANKEDKVSGLGLDGSFGKDPNTLDGVNQIASNDGGHSDYWNNPEFAEDNAQILNGEDPSVDRADNKAEAASKGH